MSVKLYAAQTTGLEGKIIDVELDVSKGLRAFTIVGLADKAVDEAKHRISYAIQNIGFEPPHKQNQRVMASLAPADVKKEGVFFDLAIACAYLLSSKQISFDSQQKLFVGELALDGSLRPIKGVLPLIKTAKKEGFTEIFVPKGNGKEAALIEGVSIFAATNLQDVVDHLTGEVGISPLPVTKWKEDASEYEIDIADIKGQETAKRALVIAAAGGHNVAFSGPPGTGKTLLARALPGILPPLSFEEALEVTTIYSVAGILDRPIITTRPFRGPHHTSSHIALVGGGAHARPGEITLAHRGVLFCDEFPEFDKRVIEALRQPLEDGVITVARSKAVYKYPARFILVAAMNPCPCGYYGSKTKECRCSPSSLFNYQKKISGPITDRIDLWTEVGNIDHRLLDTQARQNPLSQDLRKTVIRARMIQKNRFAKEKGIFTNSEMNARMINTYAGLEHNARTTLLQAARSLDLSARSYHRIIKIARTIADLEGGAAITSDHITEAIQYRPKQNLI